MLTDLSPDQAEAVALRVIAGLDTTAVARILGKSTGTTSQQFASTAVNSSGWTSMRLICRLPKTTKNACESTKSSTDWPRPIREKRKW